MTASEKEAAQTAIFARIAALCSAAESLDVASQAAVVRDLATAYRLCAGGPQPGGSVLESRS